MTFTRPNAARPLSRRHRSTFLGGLGLLAALAPVALAIPSAQFSLTYQKVAGPTFKSCCYQLSLLQKFGGPGDIVKVRLTTLGSGPNIESASASISGPATIAGNVVTWDCPTATYLDEDVTVCFKSASGPFVVKVEGIDVTGFPGFKMTKYITITGCIFSIPAAPSTIATLATTGLPWGTGGTVASGKKTPTGPGGSQGGQVGGDHALTQHAPFVDMWQDASAALYLAIGDPDGLQDVDMQSILVTMDGVFMPPQSFLQLFKPESRGDFYQVQKAQTLQVPVGSTVTIAVAVRDKQGNVAVDEIVFLSH